MQKLQHPIARTRTLNYISSLELHLTSPHFHLILNRDLVMIDLAEIQAAYYIVAATRVLVEALYTRDRLKVHPSRISIFQLKLLNAQIAL